MKVVMAGGGTGGHLFPAIAVAEEIMRINPASEVTFVGGKKGLETTIVPEKGFKLITLDVEGIKGRGALGKITAAWKAFAATMKSMGIIREIRPDGVIGSGGYSSGPVVLAARLLGVKTAVLEQNAVPGLTNRLLGRVVDRAYVTFGESEGFFKGAKVVVTGNPVRREIADVRPLGGGKKFTVFAMGGSLGAKAVNSAFIEAAGLLSNRLGSMRIIHQTGRDNYVEAEAAYKKLGIEAELHPFITDMAGVYAASDLVIGRAGATSIAEITAIGIPSILVPYPHAADAHQDANAAALSRAKAAIVIKQSGLTGSVLAGVIEKLMDDGAALGAMKEAAKKLGRTGAASAIVTDFSALACGKG